MKSEKVNEDAIRRQKIELSKKLFEMEPGMAKKIIEATYLEIAKLENSRTRIDTEKKKALEIYQKISYEEGVARVKAVRLALEDHNFRVNSDGWNKTMVGGKEYRVNPEKDIWEILSGECAGEQLFTWNAAMRETKKAGKRMPTDEEFSEVLKTKEDMPNLVPAGNRNTDGFDNRLTNTYFWSSSQYYASLAWLRNLDSGFSTVYRYNYDKAYGFSARCLKDYPTKGLSWQK